MACEIDTMFAAAKVAAGEAEEATLAKAGTGRGIRGQAVEMMGLSKGTN